MLIQAKKNLHEEYKHYKGLKKNASTMRTTLLECLATLQAQDWDINVQTHFTQLWAREAQCKLYWQIHRILQTDNRQQGLACVIDAKGVECMTKEAMEYACLQENQKRFNQAADTPLLTEPVYGLLGSLGDGPAAEAILQGKFLHLAIDPVVQDTLNSLNLCNPGLLGPTQITVTDYQAIWKWSKE